MRERGVGDALAHEGGDGEEAAVVGAQPRTVPHFSEEHVVIELREFGSELLQLLASGSLSDFFLCHDSWDVNHCECQ